MRTVRTLSILTCALLVVSTGARAQERPFIQDESVGAQRGYVGAFTGATFGNETAAAFAVEYADNIGRNVQGYATFSYFDNLLDADTRDQLRDLEAVLASLTGSPWQFRGRDRGVAFVAGGKFLIPTGSAVRPYVGGGAGAINLKRTITERTRGDLTSSLVGGLGFTDGVFNTADVSATKPLVEATVGVGFLAGPTYIDVGYRYRRAFQFTTPRDFSQFSVGIGYKF